MTNEIPRIEEVEKAVEPVVVSNEERSVRKLAPSAVARLFESNRHAKEDMLVLLESSGLSRRHAARILNLNDEPRSGRTRTTR